MADILSILAQPLASKRSPGSILAAGDRINQALSDRKTRKQFETTTAQNQQRIDIAQDAEDRAAQADRLKIEQLGKTQAMNDWAATLVEIKSFADAGDSQSIRALLQQRNASLNNARERDPTVDTRDTNQLIDLLENDPQRFVNTVNAEIAGLTSRGFIKQKTDGGLFSSKTEIYKNGTVLQSGPRGQVQIIKPDGAVASPDERVDILNEAVRVQNSNLKSDEEVKQIQEIAEFKADLGKDEEKRRLEIESLQSNIAAGKLKVAEGELQVEKAGKLKSQAIENIRKLLANKDGVLALVGPFDQSFASPTLLGNTLNARTNVQQLKSILTAENLGIMTGVLSETDLKVIADIAGGGLDVNGDDEAFIQELENMLVRFEAEEAQKSSNVMRFDAQGNLIQ